MTQNLGLLHSKEYFKGLSYSFDGNKLKTVDRGNSIASNNKILFDATLSETIEKLEDVDTISLKTTYPGLFTGSGYQHSVDGDDEFKIGFFFDFTSGQPLIPGSSVKGALRSVFPGRSKKHKSEKIALIQFFFEECLKLTKPNSEEVKKIEEEIFEGKRNGERINLYKSDIFHDAVLSNSNLNKKFLGNDYITPHNENPLRNPTPLQFLKVLPEIEFDFRFKLQNSIVFSTLTKEKKLELFKAILLFRGIGAKTNVGYGQFSNDKISVSTNNSSNNNEGSQTSEPTPNRGNQNLSKNFHISKKTFHFKKDQIIQGILSIEGDELIFTTVDNHWFSKKKDAVIKKFEEQKKKKNKSYKEFSEGDTYELRLNEDLLPISETANFTVLPKW